MSWHPVSCVVFEVGSMENKHLLAINKQNGLVEQDCVSGCCEQINHLFTVNKQIVWFNRIVCELSMSSLTIYFQQTNKCFCLTGLPTRLL